MITIKGKTFDKKPAKEVIDYLRSNKYQNYWVSPRSLELLEENNLLFLQINLKNKIRVPIRTSFLKKLFLWHKMPEDIGKILPDDLFLKVINELLHQIKSREVNVKLENNEALTITSKMFTEIKDLEVFELIKELKIKCISRNDYITRFYTDKKEESDPVPGDYCGFGFDIINSETGFSALSFNHFILRYICRNGATSPINIYDAKRNHYGATNESLAKFLDNQLKNSNQSRKNLILCLKKSNDIAAIKYKNNVIFKLNFTLGGWKGNEFMKDFEWQQSKYDVFNFITNKAKIFEINKRYQLERIAGEIILN
jgi:hypothetical protein